MRNPKLFDKLARGPQVVLLKDAAFVSAFTGIQSGDSVVDAGAGSGWLSVYLGTIVAPTGKVTAYEWREDFSLLSEKNVRKAGLTGVVEVKRANVLEGIAETNLDLITLDLAGSAGALVHAFAALKTDGFCVGFCPNIEQAKEFVLEGEKQGFIHVKTVEADEREWLIRAHGCRPATMGLRHTSFLVFLRKAEARSSPAPKVEQEQAAPQETTESASG
jgi:tRNA (adenine57-N1/adenine58-N1)-methyltransferase